MGANLSVNVLKKFRPSLGDSDSGDKVTITILHIIMTKVHQLVNNFLYPINIFTIIPDCGKSPPNHFCWST